MTDLSAAKAWYADLLGFAPYFDQPFYVGFSVAGYELGLVPAEGAPPSPGGATAYWAVGDLDEAVARALSLGATLHEPIADVGGGIRVAAVRDPFGNVLGLIVNPHFRGGVGGQVFADGATASRDVVVVERVVALAPDEVWRLWTSSAALAEWLAPNSRIELRIGGAYEWYFLDHGPPGRRGSERCVVLSFLPGRMLSFTWNAPPELPTREQHTWVVLELEPAGAGTRVRLTHAGWPADALRDPDSDWARTFRYFESAWARVLGALDHHARGRA